MSDLMLTDEEIEQKKKLRESLSRGKEQHDFRRAEMEKDLEEITAGDRAEMERLKHGGIDYSLYNYMLSTVTFKDLDPKSDRFHLDGMQRVYEGVHPYILRLQNLAAKYQRLVTHMENRMEEHEKDEWADIKATVHNYIEYAKTPLKELQRRAKERSRKGIYKPEAPKIQVVK
jgi:hypothetical protein